LVSSLLDRLHLDSDAVDRLPRGVEDPSGWLGCHVHNQTSLTIPPIDRLYDIAVWRQLRTVWSKIVHRWLDLVEHDDRRPPMMVEGFFVVWLQSRCGTQFSILFLLGVGEAWNVIDVEAGSRGWRNLITTTMEPQGWAAVELSING
jgi:hypothetical protein